MATPRRVVRRLQADTDARAAVFWYRREAGLDIAARFSLALRQATAALAQSPDLGAPLTAQLPQVPNVRSWRVAGFPYRIFYRSTRAQIELWRVLHDAQVTTDSFDSND
jgi:toxin ParE1/3/4